MSVLMEKNQTKCIVRVLPIPEHPSPVEAQNGPGEETLVSGSNFGIGKE